MQLITGSNFSYMLQLHSWNGHLGATALDWVAFYNHAAAKMHIHSFGKVSSDTLAHIIRIANALRVVFMMSTIMRPKQMTKDAHTFELFVILIAVQLEQAIAMQKLRKPTSTLRKCE